MKQPEKPQENLPETELSEEESQEGFPKPFISKEIPEEIELENSRENLSTADLIEKIEDDKEIAEFQNENKTWEECEKIGFAKFLGKMTQKELYDLLEEHQGTRDIKYVTIPEKFSGKEGEIHMVYQTTENYDPELPEIQKVDQEISENYIRIQKEMAGEYDSLVDIGKMKYLGLLSCDEIEEYKDLNKISNEKIRETPCFGKEDELKKDLFNCYEIIDESNNTKSI